MRYCEDDLLPISALQHLLFCERQCALIHVERVWTENALTVEGQHLHQKAHDGPDGLRDGVKTVRGLYLRSLQLGLVGKTDVVEFRPRQQLPDTARTFEKWISSRLRSSERGCLPVANPAEEEIRTTTGSDPPIWEVVPVEYKRGRSKRDDCDRVQLCAQAMCLEEMLSVRIEVGYLFYGLPRRRSEVVLDEVLRRKTRDAAARLHELFTQRITPRVRREAKCGSCSLVDFCLPDTTGTSRSANRFIDLQFDRMMKSNGPESDFEESE